VGRSTRALTARGRLVGHDEAQWKDRTGLIRPCSSVWQSQGKRDETTPCMAMASQHQFPVTDHKSANAAAGERRQHLRLVLACLLRLDHGLGIHPLTAPFFSGVTTYLRNCFKSG
jgi:hypothetical protein